MLSQWLNELGPKNMRNVLALTNGNGERKVSPAMPVHRVEMSKHRLHCVTSNFCQTIDAGKTTETCECQQRLNHLFDVGTKGMIERQGCSMNGKCGTDNLAVKTTDCKLSQVKWEIVSISFMHDFHPKISTIQDVLPAIYNMTLRVQHTLLEVEAIQVKSHGADTQGC
jgi:hypothetical protein